MPINYEVLALELSCAFERFLRRLLSEVGSDRLYAVGLYTSGELSYLVPTANTIEAWEERGHSKWSPPDWRYHLFELRTFEEVESILAQGWTSDFETFEIDERRARMLVDQVLRETTQRYLQDSSVLVGLFMGAMAHPWVRESIEAINPPSIARLYELD